MSKVLVIGGGPAGYTGDHLRQHVQRTQTDQSVRSAGIPWPRLRQGSAGPSGRHRRGAGLRTDGVGVSGLEPAQH